MRAPNGARGAGGRRLLWNFQSSPSLVTANSMANSRPVNEEQVEWVTHREAAKLMHVNERNLRGRGRDGSFLHYPEIARWQPGGRNTRVLVNKQDVLRWVERSQAASRDLLPREPQFEPGLTYASA